MALQKDASPYRSGGSWFKSAIGTFDLKMTSDRNRAPRFIAIDDCIGEMTDVLGAVSLA